MLSNQVQQCSNNGLDRRLHDACVFLSLSLHDLHSVLASDLTDLCRAFFVGMTALPAPSIPPPSIPPAIAIELEWLRHGLANYLQQMNVLSKQVRQLQGTVAWLKASAASDKAGKTGKTEKPAESGSKKKPPAASSKSSSKKPCKTASKDDRKPMTPMKSIFKAKKD